MKNLITVIALLLSMTGIFVSLAREELRCRLGLSSNECKPASLPVTPEPSYVPPQLSKPFSPSPSPEPKPEPSPESTPVIEISPTPMPTPEIEIQPSATPTPEITPLEEAIPIPVIPPPSPSTSES